MSQVAAPAESESGATFPGGPDYAAWAERQETDLLAHIRHHRARQRRWTWIGVAFLAGDVVAAAWFRDALTSSESLRGDLFEAWGWLSALLFLALVAGTVSVWHQTRVREARYLLALLGSERGDLIRNIVDAQTGKPAVEVDRGLWKEVDGELVKVEPSAPERKPSRQ